MASFIFVMMSFYSLLYLTDGFAADTSLTDKDIAYLRVADNGYWQVWITDDEGKSHKQLTKEKRDKTRVSRTQDRSTLLINRNDGTVALLSLKTLELTEIEHAFDELVDAAISHDGNTIAFSVNTAQSKDNNDLWMLDVQTQQSKRLVALPGVQQSPTWNGDDIEIAFTSRTSKSSYDIWTVELKTGSYQQITVGDGYKFDPAYSSSNSIAYTSNQQGNYDIWVISLETNKVTQLTKDNAYNAQPSWSPGGENMAFYSTRGDSKRIWKMRHDGTELIPLTPADANSRSPVWD